MSTQNCIAAETIRPVTKYEVSKPLRIQLIRKFQRVEGNFDCCASAYTRVCKQFECLWRGECLALIDNEEVSQCGHD